MVGAKNSDRLFVAATCFTVLFSVVGLALYGLPFYYDHMVREFGWSRTQVTSGNALSKLIIGPLFGFFAGWIVDRFGPKRLMAAGIEYLIIPLIAGELFGLRVLGRVMGAILTADGIAEPTFPMLIGYLRDRTGDYRTGFFVLVALALAGALAIAFLPRKEAAV